MTSIQGAHKRIHGPSKHFATLLKEIIEIGGFPKFPVFWNEMCLPHLWSRLILKVLPRRNVADLAVLSLTDKSNVCDVVHPFPVNTRRFCLVALKPKSLRIFHHK